jgi:hypothetical protein
LLILETKAVSEFFFSDSVQHVLECLLVTIVCQFINESSLALVPPKSNHE